MGLTVGLGCSGCEVGLMGHSQSGWVVVAVRRHTCSSGSVVREGSGSSSHSSCAVVTLSTVRIYNCAIVTILI